MESVEVCVEAGPAVKVNVAGARLQVIAGEEVVQERLTVPAYPAAPLAVSCTLPLAPLAMDMLLLADDKVKLGGGLTVSETAVDVDVRKFASPPYAAVTE
jgi:hypothetical protein